MKKEKKVHEPMGENLFKENMRYRVWMTFLFWTGVLLVALKEWQKAQWEDVGAAWSVAGLLAYGYLKWKPPAMDKFPPPLVWWRILPAYALAGAIFVETVVRYLGGREDPGLWVLRFMNTWRLEPDGDWLGVALAVVLCLTIVTRERCFTQETE